MKKLLAVIAVATAASFSLPTAAGAGGWGVISFDATPVVARGEPAELGFTFLRHGVHPESATDIVFHVTGQDGTTTRFVAVPEGREGHHVVTVELPEAGQYSWRATGMFVDIELGTFEVADTTTGSGATWRWDALQWGGSGLAVVLALAAAADTMRSRRRAGTARAATAA